MTKKAIIYKKAFIHKKTSQIMATHVNQQNNTKIKNPVSAYYINIVTYFKRKLKENKIENITPQYGT